VGAAANRVVGEAWVVPGMMLGYAGLGAGIGALVPAARSVNSHRIAWLKILLIASRIFSLVAPARGLGLPQRRPRFQPRLSASLK
jgi:hypothetical protein